MIEGMERLLNPEDNDTFDVEKAKALAGLGKVVIESAKVEVAALQVAEKFGSKIQGTGFINIEPKPKKLS
jgi:hypothetical protein